MLLPLCLLHQGAQHLTVVRHTKPFFSCFCIGTFTTGTGKEIGMVVVRKKHLNEEYETNQWYWRKAFLAT